MDQLLRVQCFGVTRDGFGAGVDQSLDHPFGTNANPADILGWAFVTANWVNRTDPGGSRGLDDYFTRDYARNIGAEIMGRNKFGPVRGPWENEDWKGWWGDTPPFRTPVFVLTHHERSAIEFPNGTSFHFVNAPANEVLHLAQKAANGGDVRLGGGPSTVRQFLEADLVDFMHLAVVPITLGRGVSLWEGFSGLEDRFTIETLTSPSGITHQLWNRKDRNV